MILGYKKMKNCAPGQLVRFQDGQYAIISEYGSNDRTFHDTILLGSGEYFKRQFIEIQNRTIKYTGPKWQHGHDVENKLEELVEEAKRLLDE